MQDFRFAWKTALGDEKVLLSDNIYDSRLKHYGSLDDIALMKITFIFFPLNPELKYAYYVWKCMQNLCLTVFILKIVNL